MIIVVLPFEPTTAEAVPTTVAAAEVPTTAAAEPTTEAAVEEIATTEPEATTKTAATIPETDLPPTTQPAPAVTTQSVPDSTVAVIVPEPTQAATQPPPVPAAQSTEALPAQPTTESVVTVAPGDFLFPLMVYLIVNVMSRHVRQFPSKQDPHYIHFTHIFPL